MMRVRMAHSIFASLFLAFFATSLASLVPATSAANEAPVKEVVSTYIGKEVDEVTGGDICTVGPGSKCAFGRIGSEAGAFWVVAGVAVNNVPSTISPEHGDIYVVDKGNQRVQVLDQHGQFVLMFGGSVNRTKEEEGAPQADRNICTKASGDVCQAGLEGSAVGQFAFPASIAVDPTTGNIYVEDFFNSRIQEFTALGEFIMMIGEKVNATKEKLGASIEEQNHCTAISKDTCQSGERAPETSTEPAAFKFAQGPGQLLAVGGPDDLLYVGDQHRVQTVRPDGTTGPDISSPALSEASASGVVAITVDQTGNLYVVYEANEISNLIHEFGSDGKERETFEIGPRQPEAAVVEVQINAIAIDNSGRLAVAEVERGFADGRDFSVLRAGLYEIGSSRLHLITEFANEFQTEAGSVRGVALAFNDDEDAMYVAGGNEIVAYEPLPVAALQAGTANCEPGPDNESDVTMNCHLSGEVNPWGVSGTEVWFEWGRTNKLDLGTPPQSVATVEEPITVGTVLEGLIPNQAYEFRLAGYDDNVKNPEHLVSEAVPFVTPVVPPKVLGVPIASFVKPFSAVLFGQVNPEHADTQYAFQYGACADLGSCRGLTTIPVGKSDGYATIGATVEVNGLVPDTSYKFRMLADNGISKVVMSQEEGSFRSAPAPLPRALVGPPNDIGTVSATISGTADSFGQPAIYIFEAGAYDGERTEFSVIASGSVDAKAGETEETSVLSGLQPSTTYAYRITVVSGYGVSRSEAVEFTTLGLPAAFVLSPPVEQLPVPHVSFPHSNGQKPVAKCRRGSVRSKHGKCVAAKKGKHKKFGRKKRRSL
jgi:DNA-binding beta-propeller fold protein YncE